MGAAVVPVGPVPTGRVPTFSFIFIQQRPVGTGPTGNDLIISGDVAGEFVVDD